MMSAVRRGAAPARRLLRDRWAVMLFVGALVVTGCADSTKGEAKVSKDDIYVTGIVGTDDDPGTPTTGGTLTIAEYAEPRSLDPTETYANGAVGGNALAAVYDTLMSYDFDTHKTEPRLAKSLSTKDSRTWQLKLRRGVKFTDGRSMDAEAVVASMRRYLDRRAYNASLVSQNLKSIEAKGDATVVVRLKTAWPTFANALAGGLGMVTAPAAYADPEKFQPIGAGPFVFESHAPGEELVLSANKDYWNGAPHLDKLRLVWLGADSAKMDSFKAGEVNAALIRAAGDVEDAISAGTPGMMAANGMSSVLWINTRKGRPGADVRVRQAVDAAIDPSIYLNRVNGEDRGLPTKSLFPESSPWFSGVEPNAVDPGKAEELLDAAKADGFDGTLTIVGGGDRASQDGLLALTAMLEKVGFTIDFKPQRTIADQTKTIYVDHDFDLAVGAATLADEDPYTRLNGSLNSASLSNPSGYASKDMDALLRKLQAAHSPADGKEITAQIEELWKRDVPGTSLAAGGFFFAWADEVHGVVPTSESMFHFDKVWIG